MTLLVTDTPIIRAMGKFVHQINVGIAGLREEASLCQGMSGV